MRTWLLVALLATPAFADEKAKPTEQPAKQTCKMKFMGKGLERKAVCVFQDPIVIPAKPPKPAVVIAPVDGRKVVGRPKQTDPLHGLRERDRRD